MEQKVEQLRKEIRGKVLLPSDTEAYNLARKLQNLMFDRKPAFVVQPVGVSDIISSVNFSRCNGVALSVKCGGHNSGGRSVIDGSLLLDLSSFKGIRVNPHKKTVRVETGALWQDVDTELQRFHLGTVGGVISTTGVAGLALGGGWGWLTPQYGLTCDNVLSMDVVTAEGQLITCNDRSHSDLFWALRGGGGNFAVVTSIKLRVFDMPEKVYGGMLIFPVERVKEVVALHRRVDPSLPARAVAWPIVAHPPPNFGRVCILLVFWQGSEAEGKKVLKPYFDLGPVAINANERTWQEHQKSFNFLGEPCRAYWKAGFVKNVTDDVIDTVIFHMDKAPEPQAVLFENYFRNISAFSPNANAYPHRTPATSVFLNSASSKPENDTKVIEWTRSLHSALSPHFIGTAMNFDAEDNKMVWLDHITRLSAVKRRYDPGNMFNSQLKW